MSKSGDLRPHIVASTTAPAYAFLGSLVKMLIGGEQSGGAFALSDQLIPAGFGPPPHIHHRDDEGFFVIDGELIIWCGDDTHLLGPGDFAYLPRGVQHTFKNTGENPARVLVLNSPPGFEDFVADVGTSTEEQTLPAPASEAEIEYLLSVSSKYGIEILVGPEAGA